MDQTRALFDLRPYTSTRRGERRYPQSRLSPEVAGALHSLHNALVQLPQWELERRRASYEEWESWRFK
jgi:hypothetical protein